MIYMQIFWSGCFCKMTMGYYGMGWDGRCNTRILSGKDKLE